MHSGKGKSTEVGADVLLCKFNINMDEQDVGLCPCNSN